MDPHRPDDTPEAPEATPGPDAAGASHAGRPERSICRSTRAAMAAAIAGTLSPAEERRMRGHVRTCLGCRTSYHEAMGTAANMGRRVRQAREERERERRHNGLRERAFRAASDPGARRRFGLRLALLPAGMALIMILWQAAGGAHSAVIHVLAGAPGEVRAAGVELGAEQPSLVLSPGDWCETTGSGQARLDFGAQRTITLTPGTQVELEDVRGASVRLARGGVELRGACRITTSLGVLSVEEGHGTLCLVGLGYELHCLAGELIWIGPAGERRLRAGDGWRSDSVLADVGG